MNGKKSLFGVSTLIAIGVGGMIGGGIFSVLGLAVDISGHAAPLAFIVAGLVALAAGYSYVKLALAFYSDGSSFTYLEYAFPRLPNLAGYVGWIVVIGYMGTLSLYAFTFGVYAADLFGHPNSLLLKSLLSSLVLIIFMIINLIGARETGISEDIIVYSKIVVLTIIGIAGLFLVKSSYYVPFFNKGHLSIFPAAAIIFVAYEGFQLITNAVCESKNPNINIPRGIYSSILIVTFVYVALTVMSIGNLTPKEFSLHGEYALAEAVSFSLGKFSRVLVDISAILATSSAINATLFGASRIAAEIATEKMMPKAFSFRNKVNVPWFALVALTVLSLVFTFSAPLVMIATFSSLTFLVVSICVAIANIRLYKKTRCNLWLASLGLFLMLVTSVMLLWYLAHYEVRTFMLVLIAYIGVGILEFFVSKRKVIFNS